jgi:hypothetical protein
LIRVQTFMLTTTATITRISSAEVLGEHVVEALERRAPVGVCGAGERLGVAERRLLGLGVKLGLPPCGQGVDLGLSQLQTLSPPPGWGGGPGATADRYDSNSTTGRISTLP